MSDNNLPAGTIGWIDLTVQDARKIKDFYHQVVGWQPDEVPMGDYADFNMKSPETGQPLAGVCHARGINAALPPYWLIYIVVENLDHSINNCKKLGGKIIVGPKSMEGHGRYAVMQDPAGAYSALFEKS
ncbi:MAG: VOC family protein [bacterium]|nr:MAG: VOC family protein [bacterium]